VERIRSKRGGSDLREKRRNSALAQRLPAGLSQDIGGKFAGDEKAFDFLTKTLFRMPPAKCHQTLSLQRVSEARAENL
jgi:hypothetical protein